MHRCQDDVVHLPDEPSALRRPVLLAVSGSLALRDIGLIALGRGASDTYGDTCREASKAPSMDRHPAGSRPARLVSLRMTVDQGIALRTAGIFFGAWLLVALAIADLPPPPEFAILVFVLLACALVIRLRIPVYLHWHATGASRRILRVVRDGLVGGGAIAVLSLLSPEESSIQPGISDRLIGFSVLIGLGIGTALAAYTFGSWLYQLTCPHRKAMFR